ncbi:PLP-dependent aminotransferase family protein [Clostridium sp.]|uniref:aminotransferase-like domain-containing protein n=1 Tax=Clostridium sp. TaxID=1506 RepID=UPI001A477DC7|nr:PLP-dependent aminotransferase family protein [Clostridium sp.]MBK5236103.1 PLP-dependent aminotransferase family protein [Clostridium sp.]
MNIRFSDRVKTLKASEIRELLKFAENPEIISFAGGLPCPELFPVEELQTIVQQVLKTDGRAALQYGPTEGIHSLREIIATQRMKPANVDVTADNITITAGSQQGIEFSAKIFLNKGDVVICESPSYLGALNAFQAYMPKFVAIQMDDNGMIIDEVEKALKQYPNAKMIYTIPDFQNPTGITMSDDRRKRLAELGAKYQIPIIEDNPYGDLIYEGSRHPSIKSFDKEGWVIYLGTFSKTFCPGLRLGWVCASNEILQKYIIVKQGADLQCSSFDQRIAALFMETYDLNVHIEKLKNLYGVRRNLMIESMDKYFPAGVKHTNPNGGLFTWFELKEGLNTAEILQEALKENVAYVPGSSFFPGGGHHNFARLNYSCMCEEKIVEGIKRLGKVLAKYY